MYDVENVRLHSDRGVETREDEELRGSSSSGIMCNISLDDGICSRLRRGLCLSEESREKTMVGLAHDDRKMIYRTHSASCCCLSNFKSKVGSTRRAGIALSF